MECSHALTLVVTCRYASIVAYTRVEITACHTYPQVFAGGALGTTTALYANCSRRPFVEGLALKDSGSVCVHVSHQCSRGLLMRPSARHAFAQRNVPVMHHCTVTIAPAPVAALSSPPARFIYALRLSHNCVLRVACFCGCVCVCACVVRARVRVAATKCFAVAYGYVAHLAFVCHRHPRVVLPALLLRHHPMCFVACCYMSIRTAAALTEVFTFEALSVLCCAVLGTWVVSVAPRGAMLQGDAVQTLLGSTALLPF